MNEVFPATFYSATARPAPARRTLLQDIETEVCVIGGGFAGLWTARALVARGQEVVVLEAGEVAGEASGQNGGFVSAGYAERLAKIVARVGIDTARELYRLSREGVEIVRSILAEGEFGLDPVPGRLHVLRHDDEVGLRDEADMLARDFDHDVVVWPRERVREALATDRYYQALHDAEAFHLHPLNLARALAADIESRGGTIYERSRVHAADLDGLRKSIWTEKGRVRAFQVVVAGSAFLGEAFPALAATVLPVRTHVVVTAPLGDRLTETIRYPGAISDTRRAGDYYRVIGDRLLWGGRISTNPKPPKDLAQAMAEDIGKVYPQLSEAPIDYAWSGTMGYAVHKMPQIGLVAPGVWIASAFGGHGLNTTAIAGELVASAMAEQDDRWRLFIPFGLVWGGGNVGRAATQMSYWSMQFKDWMDEAQTKRVEQVQADIAAGLAPGLAAHAARRAKHKFAESSAGRASARFAAALYFVLNRLLVGLRWAGAIIYAISAAVGRLLYVVIMAVATVIGFVASWVGWGMEMIAAGIVIVARTIGRLAVLLWRSAVVPMAMRVAAAAKWVWQRSRLGSTRLAQAVQAGVLWVVARVQAGLVAAGNRIRESVLSAVARVRAGLITAGNWIRESAMRAAARARTGSIAVGHGIREGAIQAATRTRDGLIRSGARIRDGAHTAAVRTQVGAKLAAERGKEAAILSGVRARQGVLWTAGRTKDDAVSSAQGIASSSRLAWGNAILPGVKGAVAGAGRAGAWIGLQGGKLASGAREGTISLGAWIAKLPGAAWRALLVPAGAYVLDRAKAAADVVIDARKRHAEANAAGRASRKETPEETPTTAQQQKPSTDAWKTLLMPAAFIRNRANAVKSVVIDARKRHAEASATARAARQEVAEEASRWAAIGSQRKEAVEKDAATSADAEKHEPHAKSKKKKKAKEKQDSVKV